MNAKKIMGAVLVALLAAALFVGAGAADTETNLGTVFFYQNLNGNTDFEGTWTNGAYSVTLGNGIDYVGDLSLPEGKYDNGSAFFYLQKPTAVVTGLAGTGATQYIVANGGDVFEDTLKLTIVPPNSISPNGWVIFDEDNVPVETSTTPLTLTPTFSNLEKGTYTVKVTFDGTITSNFVTGVPVDILTSGVAFTFNVVAANELKVSADVDSVLQGNGVAVTVSGKPGTLFKVSSDAFTENQKQTAQKDGNGYFTIPNTGKVTIYMTASSTVSGEKTITVTTDAQKTEELDLTISKGTITATIEKEAYFVGDDVTISGTSTAGKTLYIYIMGTNIGFQELKDDDTQQQFIIKVDKDGTWEADIEAEELEIKEGKLPLDAGSYTLYITSSNTDKDGNSIDKVSELGTYETVTLILKQPFISVTEAPSVAVIGTEYKVTGTAEATTKVAYYVFGTNKFIYNNATTVDEGEFEIEILIEDMAAGQYFMVVQHPMYDGKFNIAANYSTTTGLLTGDIVKNPTGNALNGGTVVFNVWERQTANAAQALCDELDLQNIDDMYVKLSFVVAAQSSVINPIPSEVTKGSKLTISGSTNVGEGETVIVEMMSTAFAAVPKETVGSASFIALTTKTNEDGTWEVTFDTTGLNVDEYTVTAAVGTLNSATAKVNVIEGAPTEQPTTTPTTQPTQTEQPTETPVQTPGFGALAALAGLGAVAVLLLRRE